MENNQKVPQSKLTIMKLSKYNFLFDTDSRSNLVYCINVNVELCEDEDDKKTKLKMVGRWQVDIWSGMSGKMHCFQCFLQQSYICSGSITFS